MRSAYPILHILLIAALLVAAIFMVGERAPAGSGLIPPSRGLATAAAIPPLVWPEADAFASLIDK